MEKHGLHTYIYIAGRVSMMRMLCPLSVFIPGFGNESPRILIQLFLSGKPVVSHPEVLPDSSNSEIEDGSDSPIKTVGTICKRIIKTVSYASCER